MSKYLLAFDPVAEGRDVLIDFIDTLPQIQNWHTSMVNTIVITSSLDASELTELLRDRFNGMRFVITVIEADSADGVLPRATWDFLASEKSPAV